MMADKETDTTDQTPSKGHKTPDSVADGASETARATDQAPSGPRAATTDTKSDNVRKFDDAIGELINNAGVLLRHGVERGIAISPEHIDAVTVAIHAYGTPGWTLEIEKNFLKSYREMSETFAGVSTQTIENTKSRGSILSIIIAIVGAALVGYIIWTQDTLIRLQASSNSYERLLIESEETQSLRISKSNQLDGLAARYTARVDRPLPPREGEMSQTELQDAINKMETEIYTLKIKEERLNNEITAQFQLLLEILPVGQESQPPKKPSGLFVADSEVEEWQKKMDAWLEEQSSNKPAERYYVLQRAKNQIVFYNAYLLPALYGVLGTVAFILRAFSRELRRLTLDNEKLLNYFIRLPLGALSGIAVGLILTEDAIPEGLAGITPLALAFIAGYSVELLFTAMDRIVIAFGGDHAR